MVMDRFAQIAQEGIVFDQEGLIIPGPIEKEPTYFSIENNGSQAFTPLKRIESEEELRAALLEERKRFLPFTEDYAPKTENLREKHVLDQALWRIQTEDDKEDFRQVLDGQGEWERVTIPHYGAPVGRARTFYRMTFDLSEDMLSKEAIYVCFKGVDYKASIFINDRFVGLHEGFFEPFEFQITEFVREKGNSMLVMVENDKVHSEGGEKYMQQPALALMIARSAGIIALLEWGSIRMYL